MKRFLGGLVAGVRFCERKPLFAAASVSNSMAGVRLGGSAKQVLRGQPLVPPRVWNTSTMGTARVRLNRAPRQERVGHNVIRNNIDISRHPVNLQTIRFGSSWELHPGHGRPSTEECQLILAAAAHKLDVLDEASIEKFASELSERANHTLFKILMKQAQNEGRNKQNADAFKKLDKDNDGVLSKEEFLLYVQEQEAHAMDPPTTRQLLIVMATSSVPFIGFGFMDNSIMILAGEVIEVNLGHAFSLTTMGAAATGNMISDVAGVGLGSYIEMIARKSGFTSGHGLSPEQVPCLPL